MRKESNSLRAVLFAFAANIIIAIIKYIVSVISGSTAILAEAIHSLPDTTNQVFLLIGRKRSRKEADEIHSFGYGKEEHFWGFLVAVLLFFLGGCHSIYEGIHKFLHPEPIEKYIYIFIVLGCALILEYKSFTVAFSEFRRTSVKSLFQSLKDSTDTNLFVILIEDFSALAGLTIVLISTLLSLINPFLDIVGTFLVGCLLIVMSYFLANELRKLMVGESRISAWKRSLIPTAMENTTGCIWMLHAQDRLIQKDLNFLSYMSQTFISPEQHPTAENTTGM